jgi:hypothetical protein
MNGKLELEYRIRHNLLVGADIFATANRPELRLRELFVRIEGRPNVKIGNIKRYLGLEELVGEEERYMIDESQVNFGLADFGYIGRSPGLLFYQRPSRTDSMSFSYYGSTSYDQTGNLVVNGRVGRTRLAEWETGLCAIVKAATPHLFFSAPYKYEYPELAYAASLDIARTSRPFYADIECFVGLNPFKTEFAEFQGEDRQVLFAAVKSLASYRIRTGGDPVPAIQPGLLLSILAHDLKDYRVNRIETRAGLDLYFAEKIRLRFNGGLVLVNSAADTGRRDLGSESRAGVEFQVRW